jgi:hypothetical protein
MSTNSTLNVTGAIKLDTSSIARFWKRKLTRYSRRANGSTRTFLQYVQTILTGFLRYIGQTDERGATSKPARFKN